MHIIMHYIWMVFCLTVGCDQWYRRHTGPVSSAGTSQQGPPPWHGQPAPATWPWGRHGPCAGTGRLGGGSQQLLLRYTCQGHNQGHLYVHVYRILSLSSPQTVASPVSFNFKSDAICYVMVLGFSLFVLSN